MLTIARERFRSTQRRFRLGTPRAPLSALPPPLAGVAMLQPAMRRLCARGLLALLLVAPCAAGGSWGDFILPPNCPQGAYRNGFEAVAPWKPGCPGFSVCEPGFWCDGVSKQTCPPGTYGSSYGLQTAACSGPCAAGHLCPTHYVARLGLTIGSVSPIEEVRGSHILPLRGDISHWARPIFCVCPCVGVWRLVSVLPRGLLRAHARVARILHGWQRWRCRQLHPGLPGVSLCFYPVRAVTYLHVLYVHACTRHQHNVCVCDT